MTRGGWGQGRGRQKASSQTESFQSMGAIFSWPACWAGGQSITVEQPGHLLEAGFSLDAEHAHWPCTRRAQVREERLRARVEQGGCKPQPGVSAAWIPTSRGGGAHFRRGAEVLGLRPG